MTLQGVLPELVGHEGVVHSLSMLLNENRLPHALLLHGPRGIGKRLVAETLAWRLICGPEHAVPTDAPVMFADAPPVPVRAGLPFDRQAEQAAQLTAGSCPDAHVLAPEEGKKSIGVKAVRDMLETLQRSADTARVCLVDCVDDLTEEAANMLLKTLEEPRPGIYFLLVSHQLSRVLPTIRSRCRMLRLTPLAEAEVARVLAQHQAVPELAALAAGCPGRVLGADGSKRLELAHKINGWRKGGNAPAANSEGLLDALSVELARSHAPRLADAMAYARVRELAAQQAEYNLPLAMVQEAAVQALPDDFSERE